LAAGPEPLALAAIRDALAEARRELGADVAYFAEMGDTRLVLRALDGDATSFGWSEGQAHDLAATYCAPMVRGELPNAIPDVRGHPVAGGLPPTAAAQVGAYAGVPVLLADGTVLGSFCCVRHDADPALGEEAVRLLRLLARVVARHLDRTRVLVEAGERRYRAAQAEVRRVGAESEERLAEAQRVARIGSFEWDVVTDRVTGSRELVRMFGLHGEDVRDVLRGYLDRVHAEDRARVRTILNRVRDAPAPFAYEHRFSRAEGDEGVVRVRGDAARDADGEVARVVGTIQDVTEERRAAAAVRAAEEADRANQAKSRFLSRMSHELRTPLTAVLGFASLLQREDLGPGQRESVSQIQRGGSHLLGLIDEILEISRIEAGELAVDVRGVSLAEAVDEAFALLRPLADEHSVELLVAVPPGTRALADQRRLRQVLLNLGANAVRYNRPGGAVRVTAESEPGAEHVRLVVADTGPGIPEAQLARLFVPFDRLGAEQRGIPGTGLGLPLSRALVEAMGGTLAASSPAGGGAAFALSLPVSAAPPTAAADEPAGPELPAPVGGRRTVLVVEDNPALVELVARILDVRPQLEVVAARCGAEALEVTRTRSPALVLLDLNLDDMSGEDVLRALRTEPATREVPVIILSADSSPDRGAQVRAAGAAAFLTKPIDIARLLATVDRVLAGPQVAATGA
jgi:PAS domain S-box-containing protein